MKIIIERGRVHNVTILDSSAGDLKMAPQDAYALLNALYAQRVELGDMALNYHDCSECGETHPNTMRVCPNIGQEGLDESSPNA